jgi:hypothetical protein
MSVTTNGDLLIPQIKVVNNVWTSKLSRMDANGNVKWSWNTSDSVSINVAMEDKNGNIIMMGRKLYPDPLQTAYSNGIAIKLDASGKETWRYAFPGQHTLENTSKIVSLSDGYIIAGNKNGPCTLTCDSASIAKLSLDGKLLWNTIIPWTAGSTTAWDVFAVLDQSNNVQVVSSRSTSYYTFDLNGKLLGWRLFPRSIMPSDALINKNGLLLILGDLLESNTRQTRLIGFDVNSGSSWTHDVYKTITDQGYVQNPRETWGMSMALTNWWQAGLPIFPLLAPVYKILPLLLPLLIGLAIYIK